MLTGTLRFKPGAIYATPGAQELIEAGLPVETFLDRHLACDWSELCEEDKQSNEEAILHGLRVFSSFALTGVPGADKLWVITEADRSCTTFLLPSEY